MKEIVGRLQEKRNIEVAKKILESNGYKVERVKRLSEASDSSNNYVWTREPNRFYDPGDPKEFLYYAPENVRDKRTVVYGQVYYPSKYDNYVAEVVKYPEAIVKQYCDSEEEAIKIVEEWFDNNL